MMTVTSNSESQIEISGDEIITTNNEYVLKQSTTLRMEGAISKASCFEKILTIKNEKEDIFRVKFNNAEKTAFLCTMNSNYILNCFSNNLDCLIIYEGSKNDKIIATVKRINILSSYKYEIEYYNKFNEEKEKAYMYCSNNFEECHIYSRRRSKKAPLKDYEGGKSEDAPLLYFEEGDVPNGKKNENARLLGKINRLKTKFISSKKAYSISVSPDVDSTFIISLSLGFIFFSFLQYR